MTAKTRQLRETIEGLKDGIVTAKLAKNKGKAKFLKRCLNKTLKNNKEIVNG